MAFVFDKCCCCIELRTGCLIIGYLNLIGEIILLLTSILLMTGAAVVSTSEGVENDAKSLGAALVVILGILVVFLILFLAFTIVLLVGLHQHKRGHVKAYLIYTLIFLVLYIIMFFAGLAVTQVNGAYIGRDVISIIFGIYFLLVIRSYYLKMDDVTNKPTVYNTA